MILKKEDRKSLSDLRMAKAREFLEDAGANHKDKRYKTSINRSYYAVLNAARALLIFESSNPETHEGTVTMLSLRFVKPGHLSKEIVKKFKMLHTRRADVDYGDFETVDERESEESLKIARETIEEIEHLRQKIIES